MERNPGNHWEFDTAQAINAVSTLGSSLFSSSIGTVDAIAGIAEKSARIADLRYQIACVQKARKEDNAKNKKKLAAAQNEINQLEMVKTKLRAALELQKYWDVEAHFYCKGLVWRSPSLEGDTSVNEADKFLKWWLDFPNLMAQFIREMFFVFLKNNGIDVMEMIKADDNWFFDLTFSDPDPSKADFVEEKTKEYNDAKKFFLLCLEPNEIEALNINVIKRLTPISFMHTKPEVLAAFSYDQAKLFNNDQLIAIVNLPKGYLPKNCGLSIRKREFLQNHPEFKPSINKQVKNAKHKSREFSDSDDEPCCSCCLCI